MKRQGKNLWRDHLGRTAVELPHLTPFPDTYLPRPCLGQDTAVCFGITRTTQPTCTLSQRHRGIESFWSGVDEGGWTAVRLFCQRR
ncbi:MAG: hypothetical protein IPL28_09545 [Chloroflexi bacterium]|nr:hypothetical protein [Chloroflexota bacterium]